MKEQLTRQECLEMYSRLELTERMIVYRKAKDMMSYHDGIVPIPLENIAKVLGVDLLPEQPEPITFTPGVPTEDGWYVVKKQNRREKNLYYETIYTDGRKIVTAELDYLDPILSHAKLPDL